MYQRVITKTILAMSTSQQYVAVKIDRGRAKEASQHTKNGRKAKKKK